ncbi:hypothetical protein BH11BAC1_BH11BAC1_03510 [soil metagenome]
MKNILIVLLVLFSFQASMLQAQVQKVVVEKYYISDANDAADTVGGELINRSVTYRIYIDLFAGSSLTKIYGDLNHALKISSTEIFFNNIDRGQSFGKDFNKSHYGDNTVALDSWLTLGQVTKTAAKTYFGILKPEDTDGSFVGGANNDEGLINNNDPDAGIPLTTADGNDSMAVTPINWGDYGIVDQSTGDDTTIFGSIKTGKEFISYNAGLQNSGVTGVDPDSNLVLVAQLTTKGEIAFELNVEVIDTNGQTIKYVANDSILIQGEVLTRSLKYPFAQVCGCPDARYLEFISDRDCDALDSCITLIVFGCMDTLACNYNPDANFNIQSLCCYPGYCSDRDISTVCPGLNYRFHKALAFNLFPNPAPDQLTFQAPVYAGSEIRFSIYDSQGKIVNQKNFGSSSSPLDADIDISALKKGIYVFRVEAGNTTDHAIFIKD